MIRLHLSDLFRPPRRVSFRDAAMQRGLPFRDTDFYTVERLGPVQALTPEGFLVCRNVALARTGPQLYSDQEIPIKGDASGRIIIDRTPEEVFRPATLNSLNGKAVTLDHPEDDVTPENYKSLLVGTVINPRRGINALDNLLLGDLVIYDPAAIKAIRGKEIREVSVGYKADYEETGPARGMQRNISCNHLALVRDGRCGPICRIGDKAFFPTHDADCGCDVCERSQDAEWDESKHNRGGDPENSGRFSSAGGGGSSGTETERKSAPAGPQTKTNYKLSDFADAKGFELRFKGFKEGTDYKSRYPEQASNIEGRHGEKFLDQWNALVGEHPADFAKRMTADIPGSTLSIEVNRLGDDRTIWYFSGRLGENASVGEYARSINPETKEAELIGLEFKEKEQGKGHAKALYRAAIDTFQRMGAKQANLHANLDVGGYAWARYGMIPDQESWDRMRNSESNFLNYQVNNMPEEQRRLYKKILNNPDPHGIWALADSRKGKKLLLQTSWHGALDFTDPAAMSRYNDYITGKRPASDDPLADTAKQFQQTGVTLAMRGGRDEDQFLGDWQQYVKKSPAQLRDDLGADHPHAYMHVTGHPDYVSIYADLGGTGVTGDGQVKNSWGDFSIWFNLKEHVGGIDNLNITRNDESTRGLRKKIEDQLRAMGITQFEHGSKKRAA